MSNNRENWETQQEAKQAAARREGPLSFLTEGGTAAARREYEERQVSDELSLAAQARHKQAVETTMKALRDAVLPDEIAHVREVLLTLNLSPTEQEELRKVLEEKRG